MSEWQVLTEDRPSAFSLDPEANSLFAAGLETERLALYRVKAGDPITLETYSTNVR